tara:strand:- start:335 stop:862 length:528 start_codon:yes stop_codon:yes gene_type:complete
MNWENILKAPFKTENFYVKANMPDADFWLQARGEDYTVGRPKVNYDDEDRMNRETASKYDWGVKILNPEIDREHLLDYVWDQYNKGAFKRLSVGTLQQHIRIDYIKEVLDKYVVGQRTPEEKEESIQIIKDLYGLLLEQKDMAIRLASHPQHLRKAEKIKKHIEEMMDIIEGGKR